MRRSPGESSGPTFTQLTTLNNWLSFHYSHNVQVTPYFYSNEVGVQALKNVILLMIIYSPANPKILRNTTTLKGASLPLHPMMD
jgi:hypothetical protein